MPELPEVETVANGVDARIRGDYIEEVWFSSKREPMKTPPAAMAKALTGRTIERVRRVIDCGDVAILEVATAAALELGGGGREHRCRGAGFH